MALPVPKTPWQRICRVTRRCTGLAGLLVVALLAAFVYVTRVGVPDWVKNRVLADLRERGIDLEFQRMRLDGFHSIVADEIKLKQSTERRGAAISARRAVVDLDPAALRQLKFHVRSALIQGGRFQWLLESTNAPTRALEIEKIETRLLFEPNDQWRLAMLRGRTLGIDFSAEADIEHGSQLTTRKPSTAPRRTREEIEKQLRHWLDTLDQIHFAKPPELKVTAHLDGRVNEAFSIRVECAASGAQTPWGHVDGLSLKAAANQAQGTNAPFQMNATLRLANATTTWASGAGVAITIQSSMHEPGKAELETSWTAVIQTLKSRWGEATSLQAGGRTIQPELNAPTLESTADIQTGFLKTEWAEASSNQLRAKLTHSLTNPIPSRVVLDWDIGKPHSEWGEANVARLHVQASPRSADTPRTGDAHWAWWTNLEPYSIEWDTRVEGLNAQKFAAATAEIAGQWAAPQLNIRRLAVELYDGRLDAEAGLDVDTREARAKVQFDFEVKKIATQLGPFVERWLGQFSWEKPPKAKGELSVVLPAWDNPKPDWKNDVLPTLKIAGEFEAGVCAFRGIPALEARSHLTFTNRVWDLPDLTARREEGTAVMHHISNEATQDHYWNIRSSIDVNALRPLFDEKGAKVFDYFQFTSTPQIEGEIWGRWRMPEKTAFSARLAISNFTFRGEGVTNFSAAVSMTNGVIDVRDARIGRGAEEAFIERAGIDLETKRLVISNATSTLEPMAVGRVIGPQTAETIAPYRFLKPPRAKVWGGLTIGRTEDTDMHFDIEGGPFSYSVFNLPEIKARLDWVTNTLVLTNVQGAFYDGRMKGDAFFDFSPDVGSLFRFNLDVTNSSLHGLMSDVSSPTNRLDGTIYGNLTITKANSSDWNSWNGYGYVTLHDGLLWDVPIFGVFSTVLNKASSGLGNSRAKEGAATYIITNSIIHTEDLEIHSPPVVLHYSGDVNFQNKVTARVEAVPLEDTPVLGSLVRLLAKPFTRMLFVYRVTGTLKEPKTEELYIASKILTLPFLPLKFLNTILSGKKQDKKQAPSPPPTTSTPDATPKEEKK